jgi:hypothetical protein
MKAFKVAIVCSGVLLAAAANPVAAQSVQVTHWPSDVPCDAIQKDGDTWRQTKDIIVGDALLRGNSFSHTGETAVWDRKCPGAAVTH